MCRLGRMCAHSYAVMDHYHFRSAGWDCLELLLDGGLLPICLTTTTTTQGLGPVKALSPRMLSLLLTVATFASVLFLIA